MTLSAGRRKPSENGTTPVWANNLLYDKIRPTLKKLGLA